MKKLILAAVAASLMAATPAAADTPLSPDLAAAIESLRKEAAAQGGAAGAVCPEGYTATNFGCRGLSLDEQPVAAKAASVVRQPAVRTTTRTALPAARQQPKVVPVAVTNTTGGWETASIKPCGC